MNKMHNYMTTDAHERIQSMVTDRCPMSSDIISKKLCKLIRGQINDSGNALLCDKTVNIHCENYGLPFNK